MKSMVTTIKACEDKGITISDIEKAKAAIEQKCGFVASACLASETVVERLKKCFDPIDEPTAPGGFVMLPLLASIWGFKIFHITDEEAELVPGMGRDTMLVGSEKSIYGVLTWVAAVERVESRR